MTTPPPISKLSTAKQPETSKKTNKSPPQQKEKKISNKQNPKQSSTSQKPIPVKNRFENLISDEEGKDDEALKGDNYESEGTNESIWDNNVKDKQLKNKQAQMGKLQ